MLPFVISIHTLVWEYSNFFFFCIECETCVHGLLDTTDELYEIITPAMEELKDASLSYFANKRLQNVNETADTLRVSVFKIYFFHFSNSYEKYLIT